MFVQTLAPEKDGREKVEAAGRSQQVQLNCIFGTIGNEFNPAGPHLTFHLSCFHPLIVIP